MPLQIRRGTEAERQILASPPVAGEMIWITDDFKLYIGDGNTLAKDLAPVTGYGDANARDAAASIFAAGTHSGISFTYNGSTAINANVSYPALLQNLSMNGFDISGNGNITIDGAITATSFIGDYKGSISADDSTILVDALNGSINLLGTVKGDIVPDQTASYDIGSVSNQFNAIFLTSSGLNVGAANVTSTGSSINLPAGSTVGGVPIGTSELISGTNHNINIVGDDSSLIVDSSTRTVTASGGFVGNLIGNTTGYHSGDVKGSVFGDDSSLLVDAVDRIFTGNLVGDLVNSIGDTIIESSNKSANLSELNIESGGTITSPSLLINSPATTFILDTVDPTQPFVNFFVASSAGTDTSAVGLVRSRGTLIAPSSVTASDEIGSIVSSAFDGSAFILAADITSVVDGAVSTGVVPSRSDFSATNSTGVTAVKMSIKASTVEFVVPPRLPIIANDTARNAAIPTPLAGMIIFNQRDDSTGVPQFQGYDGTNWVDLH